MTVKQLIKVLQRIEDQDTWVMVKGYEGGYNDVETITPEPIEVAIGVNDKWYYGAHEAVEDVVIEVREQFQIVKAIVLR
jgi:hypothetical protein